MEPADAGAPSNVGRRVQMREYFFVCGGDEANKSSFVSGSQTRLFPEGGVTLRSKANWEDGHAHFIFIMATRVTRPSEMNVKNLQRDAVRVMGMFHRAKRCQFTRHETQNVHRGVCRCFGARVF